ncbi:MAG: UvrD-helicase domain-containing protein [bacterium]
MFDTSESQSVLKEVLKKLNLQEIFKVPEAKNFISKQKNNGLDPQSSIKDIKTDYDQTMYKVYEQYQKELEKSNSLDFDDLLLLPYLLFKKDKETLKKWQNKFSYILVDEAQDTNRIQFELIKMLSGNEGNVTLIGDDFQSIYGRR